ncbi:hypothetical protein [Neobacillus sp. Marseille-QA0830]
MACLNQTRSVTVCATFQFNVNTGAVTTTVNCGACTGPAFEFNPATGVVTIRRTLTYNFDIDIQNNLTATCTLTSVTST